MEDSTNNNGDKRGNKRKVNTTFTKNVFTIEKVYCFCFSFIQLTYRKTFDQTKQRGMGEYR